LRFWRPLDQAAREFGHRGRSKVRRITTTELQLFGKNRNRSPSAFDIPLNPSRGDENEDYQNNSGKTKTVKYFSCP
jgi:hypothetical protein